MTHLRENDLNQIETVTEDGAVIDKIETWNHTHPFDAWADQVRQLAASHSAEHVDDFGSILTLNEFLDFQRGLHAKLAHDRATGN